MSKIHGRTAPHTAFRVLVPNGPNAPYRIQTRDSGTFSVPIAEVDFGKPAIVKLPIKDHPGIPIVLDGEPLDLLFAYEEARLAAEATTSDGGDGEMKQEPVQPITGGPGSAPPKTAVVEPPAAVEGGDPAPPVVEPPAEPVKIAKPRAGKTPPQE